MALATLLFATVLAAQAPVKLTHTYVKDQKVTYSVSVKMPDQDAGFSGDLTITSLDAEGTHSVSAPKIKMSMGGNEMDQELTIEKIKLDKNGLAESYEFNETQIVFILATMMSYLPDASVEKDKSFDIKVKKEAFEITGNGKLLEVAEKDGKQRATIEYKLTVMPKGQSEAGELTFKSVFDVATGQIISSEGKAEIGQNPVNMTVKRKEA